MTIHALVVGAAGLNRLLEIRNEWEQGPWKGRLELSLFYAGGEGLEPEQWKKAIDEAEFAEFLLLDLMGAPKDMIEEICVRFKAHRGNVVVLNSDIQRARSLTKLGSFSLSGMGAKKGESGESKEESDPERMMKMIGLMEKAGTSLPIGPLRDMRNYFWLGKYWRFSTKENIENMLFLIGRDYFQYKDFPKPKEPTTVDRAIIMHPGTGQTTCDAGSYIDRTWRRDGRPSAALFFSAFTYPLDTHAVIGALIDTLSTSMDILPIAMNTASSRAEDMEFIRNALMPDGRPVVDVVINLNAFRFSQGPMGGNAERGLDVLRSLDVPLLHPFFISKQTEEEWLKSEAGLKTGEFLLHLFLPELDGAIETYPIGASISKTESFPELRLTDDRVARLVSRVNAWTSLRNTPNKEKRIALIMYDYPPGESNVGSAAFLDVFRSLESILARLVAEGYSAVPLSAAELKRIFVAEGRLNNPSWTAGCGIRIGKKTYRRIAEHIPLLEDIDAEWGPFPGNVMADGESVAIPAIINGNICMAIQPARMPGTDGAMYHDKHVPPHHQYLAFYAWLQKEFRVHACIHLGTHGTLEFLPGKETAPSCSCFPDALIGSMPHIYVYYAGNPSESMIAKRRTHAVMISHKEPPFVRSGLYGDLKELDELCGEYHETARLDETRARETLSQVEKKTLEFGWEWKGIADLEDRLYEMKSSFIPSGLHMFGTPYCRDAAVEYLVQALRYPEGEEPSAYEALAEEHGFAFEAMSEKPGSHEDFWLLLETEIRAMVETCIADHLPLAESDDHPPVSKYSPPQTKQESKVWSIVRRVVRETTPHLIRDGEMDGLMRALSGRYVSAGPAGDMLRNRHVLPTGRNMYQFDPRRLPSPAAIASGRTIAEKTIAAYIQEQGNYPKHFAVVLWGLETSKTQGETVAQVFHYLGVRLRKEGDLWDKRIELIPIAELGRPRIDVTMKMSGFFRDLFPNLLALLNEAVEMASKAPDAQYPNYVRENTRRIYRELKESGMDESLCKEMSCARVFGPRIAEYGTGVTGLVKSSSWKGEDELAANFMESLKYVYTKNRYGMEMKQVLETNLKTVDAVSQIRASRDYEMTDLDHFYEFFGGLAKSVENMSGSKAMMFVSDTYEGRVRTEKAESAIQRGLHTRILNPVWIDGMLKSDFHGGQEIASRMENLVGLAATTGAVDSAVFDRINRDIIRNEETMERIKDNNPYAFMETIERLLEAAGRGYWKADAEDVEHLKKLYTEMEAELE